MSEAASRQWPLRRGDQSSIAMQFGQDRAEFLLESLLTADPEADAVAEVMHGRVGQEIRQQMAKGLTKGLASLSDPHPAVRALLSSTETLPDFVDQRQIDTGAPAFFTVPAQIHLVGLAVGSLMRTYTSPSIASVLNATGRLEGAAPKRLQDTGTWHVPTMLPGGLAPGAPGYVATIQVRMLHALSRRAARNRKFDENAYGPPISQVDLARTWMDFTLTGFRAVEVMGFDYLKQEKEDLYRYWWNHGRLLGIDPRFYRGITTDEAAGRVDEMLEAVTGVADDKGAELARASLAVSAEGLASSFKLPPRAANDAVNSLVRHVHGDRLADSLKIPRAEPLENLLNVLIKAIREKRRDDRGKPQVWEEMQAKNLSDWKEIDNGAGDATFQAIFGASNSS